MIKQLYQNPDIFKFDIPLPDNPLQNLNCYVVRSGDDTLIIDTGFNRPACMEAMKAGLLELNIDLKQSSMFLTHLHSDHIGLAYALMNDIKRPIYMSRLDYEYFCDSIMGNQWEKTEEYYEKEGLPKEYTTVLRSQNPARSFAPSGVFDAITLEDGQKIKVGEEEFTCILTPGHTPGQMCLYHEKEQIMFTADHILFNITPNITNWLYIPDSLGDYLISLQKIRKYQMKLALPAHRKNDKNVYERIEEIWFHHQARLKGCIDALAKKSNMTAYETAACLQWSMRGKCWEDFPVSQRWFAMGETLSHLDYLRIRGMVTRQDSEPFTYQLAIDVATCYQKLDVAFNNAF